MRNKNFRESIKIIFKIGAARKPNLTLFREDWIELVGKLQFLLDEIVKAHPSFAWARNITINHQLCSQKYRNLKKVYILSKHSERKKFAYKVNMFKNGYF